MRNAWASRVFSSNVRISRALAQSSALERPSIHGLQRGLEARGQRELLSRRHAAEDLAQLAGIVGRKVDGLAEAAAQAGIAVDEAAHLVG